MKLTQNWVGYLDRSYEQIKRSVLNRLGVVAPELSDHNESNPLIIILSFFSGIAEMLNYYIDNMGREVFVGKARKYTSLVRHAYNLDYFPKAGQSSYVDLVISLRDANGDLVANTKNITIPKGTVVTANNIEFRILADTLLKSGSSSVVAYAAQYTPAINVPLGTTNGSSFQKIELPSDYVHGSLLVSLNNEFWELYPSFGRMKATTKGYVVAVEEDQRIYLIFGNGTYGVIPTTGITIYGTYKTSLNAQGNLGPGSITTFETPVDSGQAGKTLAVTNPGYASAGTAIEDIESLRINAPANLRTLHRAVTYQDYIDLAKQIPGINDAEVKYCCGKFVDLYISPNSVGEASGGLLELVKREFENNFKMITTQLAVKAAGLSRIWMEATVYGNPLYTANQLAIDTVNALEGYRGYTTSKINGNVVLSDIIGLLENLPKIDRVEIAKIRIEPYVRTIAGTRALNVVFSSLPTATTSQKYRILWDTLSSNFYVYKNGVFAQAIASGGTYTDTNLSMVLTNSLSYQNNDQWEFSLVGSYPEIFPSGSLAVSDFSIPYFDIGPLVDDDTPKTIYSTITYVEQSIKGNALPPC